MANNLMIPNFLSGAWRNLDFEPFKPGISVHWLEKGAPAIAVLKYDPGARAPLHYHVAPETVLILSGTQSDANGTYHAGDLVVNFQGTQHEVFSEEGCVALLQWAKPVKFL